MGVGKPSQALTWRGLGMRSEWLRNHISHSLEALQDLRGVKIKIGSRSNADGGDAILDPGGPNGRPRVRRGLTGVISCR